MAIFSVRFELLSVVLVVNGVTQTKNTMVESLFNFTIGQIVVILPHLLEPVAEPKEHAKSQLGITACLMLRTNSVNIKVLGNLAETTIEVLDLPLYFLTIIEIAKIVLELPEEVAFFLWEQFSAKYF